MPIWQSGAGTGNVAARARRPCRPSSATAAAVLQALREVSDALIATDKVREIIAQNEIRVAAHAARCCGCSGCAIAAAS